LYHSQARIGAENDATAQGLAVLHTQPGSPSGNPSRNPSRKKETSDSASQQAAVSAGYSDTGKIPLRPLVKIHPVTQRPALFIGRHAYGIPGLEPAESDKLLEDLVAFACQPPRVYQHRWQVGDVVIWDNRCVLHRARPWNLDQARVMLHTRVNGDPATELAIAG
jgi:alpha-ketoglutarate-dependent taurine dioxygenase